ncbi:hypothetical protein EDD85DRAFT_818204 [Armillaria nabsnona]|nr:hypothetical protein EDD85DRAFT_818204 [Armillaria nabsnona]
MKSITSTSSTCFTDAKNHRKISLPLKLSCVCANVPVLEHRTALTRLLLSNHLLALERMRWSEYGTERSPEMSVLQDCYRVAALLHCNGKESLIELRRQVQAENPIHLYIQDFHSRKPSIFLLLL